MGGMHALVITSLVFTMLHNTNPPCRSLFSKLHEHSDHAAAGPSGQAGGLQHAAGAEPSAASQQQQPLPQAPQAAGAAAGQAAAAAPEEEEDDGLPVLLKVEDDRGPASRFFQEPPPALEFEEEPEESEGMEDLPSSPMPHGSKRAMQKLVSTNSRSLTMLAAQQLKQSTDKPLSPPKRLGIAPPGRPGSVGTPSSSGSPPLVRANTGSGSLTSFGGHSAFGPSDGGAGGPSRRTTADNTAGDAGNAVGFVPPRPSHPGKLPSFGFSVAESEDMSEGGGFGGLPVSQTRTASQSGAQAGEGWVSSDAAAAGPVELASPDVPPAGLGWKLGGAASGNLRASSSSPVASPKAGPSAPPPPLQTSSSGRERGADAESGASEGATFPEVRTSLASPTGFGWKLGAAAAAAAPAQESQRASQAVSEDGQEVTLSPKVAETGLGWKLGGGRGSAAPSPRPEAKQSLQRQESQAAGGVGFTPQPASPGALGWKFGVSAAAPAAGTAQESSAAGQAQVMFGVPGSQVGVPTAPVAAAASAEAAAPTGLGWKLGPNPSIIARSSPSDVACAVKPDRADAASSSGDGFGSSFDAREAAPVPPLSPSGLGWKLGTSASISGGSSPTRVPVVDAPPPWEVEDSEAAARSEQEQEAPSAAPAPPVSPSGLGWKLGGPGATSTSAAREPVVDAQPPWEAQEPEEFQPAAPAAAAEDSMPAAPVSPSGFGWKLGGNRAEQPARSDSTNSAISIDLTQVRILALCC